MLTCNPMSWNIQIFQNPSFYISTVPDTHEPTNVSKSDFEASFLRTVEVGSWLDNTALLPLS